MSGLNLHYTLTRLCYTCILRLNDNVPIEKCDSFISAQNIERLHYANMPMQYAAIFKCCKIDNFR